MALTTVGCLNPQKVKAIDAALAAAARYQQQLLPEVSRAEFAHWRLVRDRLALPLSSMPKYDDPSGGSSRAKQLPTTLLPCDGARGRA